MRFLDDLLADGSDKASHAADTVRDYASRAASTARHTFDAAAEQAHHRYADAEHFVQERPATSVGAAFAAGALVGFCFAMLVREG